MPPRQNYAGRTFGQITLDAPSPTRPGYWQGHCSCGNPVEKRIDNLKRPGNHTCGRCPHPVHAPNPDTEARLKALEDALAALQNNPAGHPHNPAGHPPPTDPNPLQPVRQVTPSPMPQPTPEPPPDDPPTQPDKIYPIPKEHHLHHHFYYQEDPEGLALETTWEGKPQFLGFHNTTDQVREAICDYLASQGADRAVTDGLFPNPPAPPATTEAPGDPEAIARLLPLARALGAVLPNERATSARDGTAL